MSILKKLFGGGDKPAAEATAPAGPVTEYEGFRITPEPMPADGQFRIAATIEREIGGELRTHKLIRADVLRDRDEAAAASVQKARQLIDQMGERLFD